jgi:hypothetical protein
MMGKRGMRREENARPDPLGDIVDPSSLVDSQSPGIGNWRIGRAVYRIPVGEEGGVTGWGEQSG